MEIKLQKKKKVLTEEEELVAGVRKHHKEVKDAEAKMESVWKPYFDEGVGRGELSDLGATPLEQAEAALRIWRNMKATYYNSYVNEYFPKGALDVLDADQSGTDAVRHKEEWIRQREFDCGDKDYWRRKQVRFSRVIDELAQLYRYQESPSLDRLDMMNPQILWWKAGAEIDTLGKRDTEERFRSSIMSVPGFWPKVRTQDYRSDGVEMTCFRNAFCSIATCTRRTTTIHLLPDKPQS